VDGRAEAFRALAAALKGGAVQGSRWWLVCYDVRDPKRLRRTAKHLEGYGGRVQYSVFRCWLSPSGVQRLRWELTEMLTPEDDVIFIPLCSRCAGGISVTHAATKRPDWPEEPPGHQVV
jgi:CRISPR-associated protein Cas2